MGYKGPVPAVQAAKAGWGTTSLPAALDTACRDGLCALLWWQPQLVAKWLVPLPINQSINQSVWEVEPLCRHKEEMLSFIHFLMLDLRFHFNIAASSYCRRCCFTAHPKLGCNFSSDLAYLLLYHQSSGLYSSSENPKYPGEESSAPGTC